MTTVRLMLAGGTGRLVRRPSVVLFDPTGQNQDLASRFDSAPSDTDAVDELKKYLIESGFSAAPLVVAEWARGEFNLLVFGDVEVHTSAIAAPMVSGAGSSTWVERHLGTIELGSTTKVEVWSGEAADPTTNLGLGVVACAGFRMSLDLADLDGQGGVPAAQAVPVESVNAASVVSAPELAADPASHGVPDPFSDHDFEASTVPPTPAVPTGVAEPAAAAEPLVPVAQAAVAVPPSRPALEPFIAHDSVTEAAPSAAGGLPGADADSSIETPRAGLIEAVHCSLGHPNPVQASACRVCGEPLLDNQSVSLIEKPMAGRIVFSGGQQLGLEHAVMMGRKPSVQGLEAHPVLIDHVEVSRTHAVITTEGWTVLLTDHDSRNGTWVTPANEATPVRLEANVSHVLEHGTAVHLGAPEVAFTYYLDND